MNFVPDCRDCPRLARFLKEVRREHPDYHAQPVAPFGDRYARFVIVGLAPGMHGANRSGRPFTGDFAGILLYETLYKFGFASAPQSVSRDDGLRLIDCRITNAVKCLPPANKPEPGEVRECNKYLTTELAKLGKASAILALGTIAHDAVLMAFAMKKSALRFAHGAQHELPNGAALFDSYHCSRYNTQTKRLTEAMFNQVLRDVKKYLSKICPKP